MRRSTAGSFIVLLSLAGLVGCSSSDSSSTPAASSSEGDSITVFAASSLTEAFTTIGTQFEAANPGVHVTFSFAASSDLATQITNGGPADVFASASTTNMDQIVTAGSATDPAIFAKNVMEVAVPPTNPGNVTSVNDLASTSVKTALCQPEVPCGSTAQQVFTNADLTVTPVTLEPDVKSVLSKVTLGEVDAGVVYVTDVQAAGDQVKGITIPKNVNASTSYPIASMNDSSNPSVAQDFVDYVLSADGQRVLAAAGFEQP